ncbi:MAG TPA: methionine--tRNA ligase [Vicinamibacterales bacterium]|nr:methionine--tRNA ligase [Vicinamibacterales bacterium]
MPADRFYLTTAIDYVNSRPHLGTAYEKITADVIARDRRLRGHDVRFVMGNDEHSQNVFRKARELGMEPLAYCDRMEQEFRDVWKRLDISFDDFIRTTEPRHRAAVTRLAEKIAANGDIYEGYYEGWYCVSCEAFKQEKDLVDGNCPVHLTKPEWIKEKNHFFRLSKYRDRLLGHFNAHPGFLEPEIRRNEILRLLEAGLEDISVSRAGQSWGIPLPTDPSSVIYVWFDALINYIAAVGYGTDDALFATWWPANLHVIGKDITRFHCVVWPAMLMSGGVPLPERVFGHGWVHYKGQKMSKSLGTVIDPFEAADRLGADPLRLYLVKEISYGGDGDFTWDRFEERYNVDLANNLGNLVSRISAMADRYRHGRLKGTGATSGRLADVATGALARYAEAMDVYALHDGAAAAFTLVDAANEFIAETEPWTLARDPARADRLDRVLYDVSEALRIAAILLLPTMPSSSTEILRRVGETKPAADIRFSDARWQPEGERIIQKRDALWPRLEPAAAAGIEPTAAGGAATGGSKEIRVTENKPQTPGPLPPSPAAPPVASPAPAADDRLSIDDFMRIQLRVARILAAEKVPNSRKLIKMQVDLGTEQRTIVAGIAEAYEPEQLVGRTIAMVTNLKPAKLMGIESNGMLLAASPEGGQPVVVMFDQPVAPGTRIR